MEKELEQERAYKRVAKNHGYAVRCLGAASPACVRAREGGSKYIYGAVVQGEDLRRSIGIYLGRQNPGTLQFDPYQLSADQLRNPGCCRTIAEVVRAVEKFKQDYPDEAQQFQWPTP